MNMFLHNIGEIGDRRAHIVRTTPLVADAGKAL